MKYITRNLENVVRTVTKEYPAVLVTGPRQVGKTTMRSEEHTSELQSQR